MTARIDVHQHIIPSRYLVALNGLGIGMAGLAPPTWSEDLALAAMDRCQVETAVVSISVPGVHFGDDAAARVLAREMNDFAADLAQRRGGRFSFFASLTLPDVEGSLAELAYAIDELHAAGVILLANSRGRYLGDPTFEPLLAELDRRGVLVFVHPAQLPGPPADGIPPYIADFLLDTTRAAVNLVRNDAIRRYPAIRFILSHGGGFLPFAAARLAMTMTFDSDRTVDDFLRDMRSFHVDTAQAVSPYSMPGILDFFGADHVLFGTDWPHASDPGVDYFALNYDRLDLGADVRAGIDAGNARRLLSATPPAEQHQP